MISDGNSKPDSHETDPAKVAKLLEIELMQKRASWQQAKARRNNLRAMSFLFLFAVIAAALAGYFIFFSPGRVDELRSGSLQPSPSPSASPN